MSYEEFRELVYTAMSRNNIIPERDWRFHRALRSVFKNGCQYPLTCKARLKKIRHLANLGYSHPAFAFHLEAEWIKATDACVFVLVNAEGSQNELSKYTTIVIRELKEIYNQSEE